MAAPSGRQQRGAKAKRDGHRWEAIAAWLLRLKGYRILARNWRSPMGEIDLIARRGATLAFIEVKVRATQDSAAAALRPQQQARIARAALLYLQANPRLAGCEIRLDALLCAPGTWPRHIKQAWDAGVLD